MTINRTNSRRASDRRGVTAVELAIVVPIVLMLFLGMWEICRFLNIRETIALASMEGARKGIVPGATATDATNAAKNTCAVVGVTNPTVTTASTASDVTVTVAVQMDQYAWVTPLFLKGKVVQSTTTLKKN